MTKELEENFLSELTRAEDILLGSLGYGESAKIVTITKKEGGFSGVGKWADGEVFAFESQEPLAPLETWALQKFMEHTHFHKKMNE